MSETLIRQAAQQRGILRSAVVVAVPQKLLPRTSPIDQADVVARPDLAVFTVFRRGHRHHAVVRTFRSGDNGVGKLPFWRPPTSFVATGDGKVANAGRIRDLLIKG